MEARYVFSEVRCNLIDDVITARRPSLISSFRRQVDGPWSSDQ